MSKKMNMNKVLIKEHNNKRLSGILVSKWVCKLGCLPCRA